MFLNENVKFTNWVKINGSLFKPKMIIVIGEYDNEPIFGIIKHIFIRDAIVHFVYAEQTAIFDYHTYAYEIIGEWDTCKIVNYENMHYSKPLSFITKGEKSYVLCRSYF